MKNLDVEAIERATVAALAPAEVEEFRGWLIAYDSVTVNRARSAVPLRHDAPDDEAVRQIYARYRLHGMAPSFRVPEMPSMMPVDYELRRLGLRPHQSTRVMIANAEDIARAAPEGGVHIAAAPDSSWGSVFLGAGFDPIDGASRVQTLTRAPGSLFASIRQGDEVVAAGVLAMGHGWASIHGMRTALAHRGKGLATRVLATFAREALQRDHPRIVLQVEIDNEIATHVYRRSGFRWAWTYAYWR